MSHHHGTDVATTMVTPATTCPSQRVFEATVRSGDRMELQRLLKGRPGKFNVNLYDDDGQTVLLQSCLGRHGREADTVGRRTRLGGGHGREADTVGKRTRPGGGHGREADTVGRRTRSGDGHGREADTFGRRTR